ncbi:MAG: hypothetical protein LW625_05480 [Planctomycetaceae bacterium]|nr:hypothetical protein [Planctomycetaceae bacterium]
MRNRSRIAALFATLLACVATGAARAQTTIADFTGNALPTGWTAANTNTNVLTLAPTNGQLQFSTAPLLSAASTDTNYAAISSPWGIGTTSNFKLKLKCRFVRQNYPNWQQNEASVTESVGILAHLTTVDTFIGTVMPDGLALSLGSFWDPSYGNLRSMALTGINAGTPTTITERYGWDSTMYLNETPTYPISVAETVDAYMYISYVASTGALRFSFNSFDETAPYAFQFTPNNPNRRPLRLSLGGFTTGKVRAMLGSQAWIDDVVLQEGVRSYRPDGLVVSQGTSTSAITLNWNATPGATGYKVYREGVLINSPTTNTFTDTTANAGVRISYFVRAVSAAGDSESSTVVPGWRNIAAPTGLVASNGTLTTGINLNWTAVPGVMGYKIYRSTGSAVPTFSSNWNTNACVDNSAVAGTLYNYAITAVTAAGETVLSAIDTGWRKPLPPASVTATDGTSLTGVTISWPAATGAASYKVFRAIGTGTATQIGTVTAPTLTYTDTTAVGGTLYNYSVRTSGQTGTGDSDASAVNAGWRQIAAPAGLASTSGSSTTGVNLSWTSATGAVSYKVFRGIGSASAQVGTSSTTTYADASAVPGTIYTYAIKAVSLGGDSAASATITSYRGLSAPLSVAATDGTSAANVTVTWAASTGATGYKIFRAIGSATATQVGTTTALTFADTTAVPGTIYTYSVKDSGVTGVSDSAASATNTGYRGFAAPLSVAATDGTSTTNVTVTWAASTSATGYKIFRAIGSAVAAQIGTTTTALTFADTTAVPGTIYTYSVKASGVTGVSDSAASVSNTGYRGFIAPSSVAATDGTSTANVTVTWVASTGATGYKIFRAIGSAVAAQIGTTTTALTFADTTAVPGTIYTYSVKASGVTGVSDSAASVTTTGYRGFTAPISVAATDGTSTANVTVTWASSTGATGYKILRAIGSAVATQIGTTTTALTFADTTAVPGTIYTYSVKASGVTGVSESALSTANTGYRGFTAPTSVAATDGTSTANVTVTWVASTGATSYKIFRGATQVGTVTAPATSYADTGAVAGTVYSYTVKAAGPSGVSDSAASSANTGWRNLSAPTGVIASDTLTTKINVKWNAITGATGYKLYRGTSASSLTLLTTVTTLTFDDTTAVVGTTYTYAVTARSAAGESARSATDTGVRVAGFMTAGSSKPQDGGDGSYAPNTTEAVTEEPEIAPMGVQRYLQVIAITRDAAQTCAVAGDVQPISGNTTEVETTDGESADPTNAPAIIDLDQNGEPDLCQLRRGDLDLSGQIDEADVALLLTMLGEEPVLDFGDLNGDGVIDGSDVQALSQRMDALANTT